MKTVKQIADEIGVDKQKVYRYIVRHGIHEMDFDSESGARNKTKYYDDRTVQEIMDAFHKSGASQESTSDPETGKQDAASETESSNTHTQESESAQSQAEEEAEGEPSDFVSFLMQQVEEKDRQIFNLQKLLDQEQRLHLQTQAALDKATRQIEAIEEKDAVKSAEKSEGSTSDMIHEIDPYDMEMKPVTPAPASEEEPATVQTVSEVMAQAAARREESEAETEPIFHDTEPEENQDPPKKKGFWKRLFGL